VLRRTMPQILMLNHAAHTNRRRMDLQMEAKREGGTLDRLEAGFHEEAPVWRGKKFSELTSDEMMTWIKE
jgi:hypothetical protein